MNRGSLSWKQGCTRAGALHTACGLPHSRIGSDPKDWYKYSKQVNTFYSDNLRTSLFVHMMGSVQLCL